VIRRIFKFVILLLILICWNAVARASQPVSVQEILAEMSAGFASFDGAYVECDVYTIIDGKAHRWLTLQEALSDKIYYNRVIHWYYQLFYRFDSADLDPLLNSYYWSENRRILIKEPTGMVNVSKGIKRYIAEPNIKRYFGHIGLLTPERVTQPSAGIQGSDADIVGYNVRDYYMCTGIANLEEWKLTEIDDKTGRATIMRSIKNNIETITVDRTLRSSIVKRDIAHVPSKTNYTIECDDFVQLFPALWLPQKLSVQDTGGNKQIYYVTKISRQIPEHAIEPDTAQPGFRIRNDDDGTETIIPGGEKLLDEAIERMRLAKAPQEYRNWTSAAWWLVGFAVQLVLYFILRRLMTGQQGQEAENVQL
jgi:hypothetical protein